MVPEEIRFLEGPQTRSFELARAVRIFLEFMRGFRALHYVGPCVTVLGSARFKADHPYYDMARDLGAQGIRSNLVAAGPIATTAARSIPMFEQFAKWGERAPLGWDLKDAEPAAKACVALLSDWFPATTGEIVHVDGGFHAMGF